MLSRQGKKNRRWFSIAKHTRNFEGGSRIINGMTGCVFKGARYSDILAPTSYPFCRHFSSFKCLSQCTSHPQHCSSTSLGVLQTMRNTGMLNNNKLVGNLITAKKFDTQQGIIGKCNFHTSSCLNIRHDDYQYREKRTANILIVMCIVAVVGLLYGNSLIDLKEYDKPTVAKE